ncbi:MAG: hypothetical protein QUS09_08000, partial [Methanotrichaceae archaeon]|nr:hypothetical protein [Methanotrichaceae archaeon]
MVCGQLLALREFDVKKYGAGAYPGPEPIGGGPGFSHYYSESDARYIVENLDDLNLAMKSAESGQLIWIPGGVTITISTCYSLSLRQLLPYIP